ncbi:MAG: aspartyl protease family protein [Kofleriaceae bacterium]
MKTLLATACVLAGCSVGALPGFSSGDSWTAPMIGPVEDGLILVPVFINGKGPYTFAVDTDSNYTVLTQHIVNETGMRLDKGPKLDDEADKQRDRFYAEVLGLEVGTLTIERVPYAEVLADHAFDVDGRSIDGLLGRDVIADSLAFEFDRDRGMITIMTQAGVKHAVTAFSTPPIKYQKLTAQILAATQPVPRKLVTAQIDGQTFAMHVDFGATNSMLRDQSWQKAALVTRPQLGGVIDEVGTPRTFDHMGEAASVTLAGITTPHVEFVPYIDKRFHDEDLDGSLGLGFFHDQTVLVNWDQSSIFTKPRGDLVATTAARIARWRGTLMPKCSQLGCVTLHLVDPLAGKPPEQRPAQHPGVIVSAVRDPAAAHVALEVLVEVQTPDPAAHPQWLVVNLPADIDRAMTHLSAAYVGAQLTVVDASPFPRSCADQGGCIDTIRPPGDVAEAPAPAPAEPAPAP